MSRALPPVARRSSALGGVGSAALALLGAVALLPRAAAQPVPKLDTVSATWFQRGTTNDVTLTGEGLVGLKTLHFTGGGLSGSLVWKSAAANVTLEGASGGLSVAPLESGKSVTAQWVVAPDAALGSHEVRIAGPGGVSNPLTIHVSDLTELPERKPDNQPKDAPTYTLPAAISGVVEAAAESDYLRFKLRAGEKATFDLQANRFGSPLDATLILLDSSGKEVGRSEDANGLDPFLEFTPPSDGEYVARVFDTRFQGGGDYRYRLVAGVLPYLDYLFPFGGMRGGLVELQFKGRNLDGAEKLNLRIATDAPLGRQDIRAHTPRGYSNPLPFEAGDLPEAFEAEPNNANDQATAVTPPVVINGRIGEAKDLDVFRFKAAADQKLVAEVRARSFGSPLDALLTLSDAKGAVLARNDDADGPDARLEFDAKKDTEYFLSLRDLTDRGGERFGYRLAIHPPDTKPDFAARASGGRFRLTRGGNTAIRCEVERRNGFDGTVRVTGEGLPAGVTASVVTLAAEPNFGWLVLSAAMDAPLGNFPLRCEATGELAGKAVFHGVQFSEQGWLTILPPAPFSLDVAESSVIADQNATGALNVSVIRREGFSGDVKVMAEGVDGVDIPAVTIPAGQSRGKLALKVAYNAAPGVRPIMVRGETGGGSAAAVEFASAPAPLTIHGIAMFLTAMLPGSTFFRTDEVKLSAVALPTNAASAANSTEFVVKVDRRGLTGEIALSLEGLPPGVVATVPNLAANAKDATIKLLVTDKAETGKEAKLAVVGSATYNDRIWRQKTQTVTLMVAAPEKEPAQAAAAPAPAPVGAPGATPVAAAGTAK